MKGKEDSVLSVQRLVMMKAVKVMKAEAGVKVVESKSTVQVMEVIASIATVVRIAIITAIIAAGVLGYPTTGAGRTQTASAEVCCKCFLISNYWRCGKC